MVRWYNMQSSVDALAYVLWFLVVTLGALDQETLAAAALCAGVLRQGQRHPPRRARDAQQARRALRDRIRVSTEVATLYIQ